MRTPVASKNAFATAAAAGPVGGSPEPESSQPSLYASVLPAWTSSDSSPGLTTVYLPGCTLTSVTVGLSLKRRIGYETQSRVVTRSLFHATCSLSARDRPWMNAPLIWFVTPSRLTVIPLFWVIVACLATIFPVFTFTSASTMQQACEDANVDNPMPVPLRTSPVCAGRPENATLGL